jgi:DNA (cytosine-5)-methyltransferase 1
VADTECLGRPEVEQPIAGGAEGSGPADSIEHSSEPSGRGWWATEPGLGRVADGVPNRVDRLEELGNAVVPQIPEIIGNAILESLAA